MYGSMAAYWAARDDGVQGASGVEGEALSGIEHQSSLPVGNPGSPALNAVSPFVEMGAYEAIWAEEKVSFKALAERFAAHPGHLPSDFVPSAKSAEYAHSTMANLAEAGVHRFGVRLNGAAEYPDNSAMPPIPLNCCTTSASGTSRGRRPWPWSAPATQAATGWRERGSW